MISSGKHSQFSYKIVLIGDSGVGKSNIISRFTKNQFDIQSKTTIGVQFATKTLQLNGTIVKVQVWDTAGQQRYRSMASAYYRGASGAMLIYDITHQSSFQSLQKWSKQLKSYAPENIVCLLIGNKADLSQYRSLKSIFYFREGQHGLQYAKQHHMGFLETSALDGSNIDIAFMQMIGEILDRNRGSGNKNVDKGKEVPMRRQTVKIGENVGKSAKRGKNDGKGCCK